MKRNIVSIGTVTMMLFLFNITQATVWYVHPDSTFNTIQTALDSCSIGDTVLVGPGTYFENIVWPNTQKICLTSELGPDLTIIDGDNADRVITCTTDIDTATVIKGFTIRNGYTQGSGGGISCISCGLKIVDNIFLNNAADARGGAIYCYGFGYKSIISDNTIIENTADDGSGITIDAASYATISNNVISQNFSTHYGGGIYLNWGGGADISYNTITFNFADYGGGIHFFNSGGNLFNNFMSYNTAYYDGGAIYQGGAWGEISLNTITHNTAFRYGGGICFNFYEEPQVIVSNTITDNTGNLGAGIACRRFAPVFIDSCVISNNNGDGIYCDSNSTPQIHYNNIVNNTGYAIRNVDSTVIIDAEINWWGHSSGPFHPDSNPGGLGDTVSDYVDFEPWLWEPAIGLFEQNRPLVKHTPVQTTIVRGVLYLPSSSSVNRKALSVLLDITGRKVADLKSGANNIRHLAPGVYFIRNNNNNQVTKIIVTR